VIYIAYLNVRPTWTLDIEIYVASAAEHYEFSHGYWPRKQDDVLGYMMNDHIADLARSYLKDGLTWTYKVDSHGTCGVVFKVPAWPGPYTHTFPCQKVPIVSGIEFEVQEYYRLKGEWPRTEADLAPIKKKYAAVYSALETYGQGFKLTCQYASAGKKCTITLTGVCYGHPFRRFITVEPDSPQDDPSLPADYWTT
jgi:hypothetical protein